MTRVIVVDDDFRVAAVHCGFVSRLPGFTVVGEAHSGRHALALAAELKPDLMLLDIYLPDVSGIDVLQQVRNSKIDVIAVTAARDTDTLRTAMRHGVVHYLIKPFTFEAFREKMTSYASWADALDRSAIVGQDDVDRLVGNLRTAPAERELPKGLSETTLETVRTIVETASEPMTAVDVADRSGVSRVTARRYLDYLVRADVLGVRPVYGRSGRPVHEYVKR